MLLLLLAPIGSGSILGPEAMETNKNDSWANQASSGCYAGQHFLNLSKEMPRFYPEKEIGAQRG